jgi:hypothetical protein
MNLKYDFEWNLLEIYNYRKPGKFSGFLDWLKKIDADLEGDIVEAGVYRGSSILSLGLYLKEINSKKKVYGFDSFSGFPSVTCRYDRQSTFGDLHSQGLVDKEHISRVERFTRLREKFVGRGKNDCDDLNKKFSDTNLEVLREKIDYLGLDNIVLVEGDFGDTMTSGRDPQKISAAVLDCDLYESYQTALHFCWARLESNGLMYLDEYYSLRYPGARVAINEFISSHEDAKLNRLEPISDQEFERWAIIRELQF